MELELRLTRAEVEALRAMVGEDRAALEVGHLAQNLQEAEDALDAEDPCTAAGCIAAHNLLVRRLRAQLKEAAPAAATDSLK